MAFQAVSGVSSLALRVADLEAGIGLYSMLFDTTLAKRPPAMPTSRLLTRR
jgi:hypothetical protein